MVRIITAEEELTNRRENFEKLSPGRLFNLGQERWQEPYFIAIRKLDEQSWEVIELDERNRRSIITGESCKTSILSFEQMACLNLCKI